MESEYATVLETQKTDRQNIYTFDSKGKFYFGLAHIFIPNDFQKLFCKNSMPNFNPIKLFKFVRRIIQGRVSYVYRPGLTKSDLYMCVTL